MQGGVERLVLCFRHGGGVTLPHSCLFCVWLLLQLAWRRLGVRQGLASHARHVGAHSRRGHDAPSEHAHTQSDLRDMFLEVCATLLGEYVSRSALVESCQVRADVGQHRANSG